MNDIRLLPVIQSIINQLDTLTPKGVILGNYIIQNPRKAVFMTTKELAETCQVSEATVVRFVSQLGYGGYGDFLQALRDCIDTDMSLPDRVDLPGMTGPGTDRFHRVVLEEMNNLRQLFETMDIKAMEMFLNTLAQSRWVYVVGSRLSNTSAYYMGWSLTKVRKGVRILRGSDSTSIDWLTNAEAGSVVILFATSRYPNELIKLGKLVRRLELTLLVIADSNMCPLNQFAHQSLVVPSKSIPLIGYPTAISCLINYLVLEAASREADGLKSHQKQLEQIYLENDLLFNFHSGAS